MNLSKDKHIFIPLFLAFAAIVGFRAWRDMHAPPPPPRAIFDTYYVVRSDKQMAPFTTNPDDDRVIVAWAGNLNVGKDGNVTVSARPVSPISLPQREIVLFFTMNALPRDPAALAKAMGPVVEKWHELGDLVNDVYIDAPTDKDNFSTLLDEVDLIREDLHHQEYWLGLYADRKTLEALPNAQTKLEDAGKSVRTIIVNAKEGMKPGEKLADFILAMDRVTVLPFAVEVDKTPDYKGLKTELHPEPQRFVGFLLDSAGAGKATQ